MIRWIETLGILFFTLLMALSYVRLFGQDPWLSVAAATFSLPFAYYVADLLTGIIHWICDSFGSAKTPIWGPMLVAPFRRHHQNPIEITQISLAENLGASSIAGSMALLALPVRVQAGSSFGELWGSHFWLFIVIFSVLSNRFHRWAHLPQHQKSKWLVFLQKKRLILSSKDHLVHHARPYRVNYCILNGWANPLTNWVPWGRIEAVFARFGIKTNFD